MKNTVDKSAKNSQDVNESVDVMEPLPTYRVEIKQTLTLTYYVKAISAADAKAVTQQEIFNCDNDLYRVSLNHVNPKLDTSESSIKVYSD